MKMETVLTSKGCNCKRSNCLKNYCECYQIKVTCSSNCKCSGCGNFLNRETIKTEPTTTLVKNNKSEINELQAEYSPKIDITHNSSVAVQQETNATIEASMLDTFVECFLSQLRECIRCEQSEEDIEKFLLMEYNRCVKEIYNS